MEILRTPDEHFENLLGYPFAPNYVDIPSGDGGSQRMHYVDEGPRDGAVILLLHGEPSWSYLYRKMIPVLTQAGYRAVAPDLIGFGRSDKPTPRSEYTYQRHVGWMAAFLDAVDIQDVTLVCQDWGGLIGLRLAAEDPDRFARIVAANTFLPTGDEPANEAFMRWRNFSQSTPTFDAGWILNSATTTDLSEEIREAYNAPFPDDGYKEGARQFPLLVPITPDDPEAPANRAAWESLSKWTKPFLTAFGDSDPIMKGSEIEFQTRIPGARGQPHTIIAGAGHFIQEDRGEELARVVVDWMSKQGA